MLDNLKFWKDDDFDLDSELPPLDDNDDMPGMAPGDEPGKKVPDFNPENSLHEVQKSENSPFQQQSTGNTNRDFDLINSKLDTIKAELDSMNQRIMKIEKIAEGETKENKKTGRKDPWSNF